MVYRLGNDTAIRYSGFHPGTVPDIPHTQISPRGLSSRLTEGSPACTWATWEHSLIQGNGSLISQAINSGTAIAVSDGSFREGVGTSAFVLEGPNSHGRIVTTNVVPGESEDQSAYRSELAGLYGIISTVEQICLEHSITQGSITIGCDGAEALRRAAAISQPVHPRDSDGDLIHAIRTKTRSLPIIVHHRWIKGHQDTFPGQHLDRWATLNIEMDLAAKRRLRKELQLPSPVKQILIEGEPSKIFLGGKKVTKDLAKRLFMHCEGAKLSTYWASRRLGPLAQHHIDWQSCGRASKLLSIGARVGKTKRVSGFIPVGKCMLRWKFWDNDRCPRCGNPEDARHVLQCSQSQDAWTTVWSNLTQWFNKNPSFDEVLPAIQAHMEAWQCKRTLTALAQDLPSYSPLLLAALTRQNQIGWYQFLDGFVAKEWESMQRAYYTETESRRSPSLWVAGLIRCLWESSRLLWKHRNDTLHADAPNISRHLERTLNDLVRLHFRQGPGDLPLKIYRHLFRGTVSNILSQSTYHKQQWLDNVVKAKEKLLRSQGLQGEASTLSSERKCLRDWLRLGPWRPSRYPQHLRRRPHRALQGIPLTDNP